MAVPMENTTKTSFIGHGRPEIRIWHAPVDLASDVPLAKRYSFIWKEGCLMGLSDVPEENGEPAKELKNRSPL